jgi:rhamnulokinase
MKMEDFLAFDMGASNGRGIIGRFDGKRVCPHGAGGFENKVIPQGEMAHRDLGLMPRGIRNCFVKTRQEGFDPVYFGIDTRSADLRPAG